MKQTKILGALVLLGVAPLARASLIAYYPFDDTTGDTAVATYGKDATWQNTGTDPAWSAVGPVGTALTLDGGGNNFFNVDLDGLLNSDKMTVSMWLNPNGNGSYKGLFMVRPANPGVGGTAAGNGNFGLAWRDLNGGYIDARGPGATVTADESVVTDDATAGNEGWYHVMWVWDGEFSTQTIFLNGVEVAAGSANFGTLIGGTWQVGNDSCCGNGRVFNGLIDDLGVWNEALTVTEAAGLFDKSLSPADINPPTDNDNDGLTNEYEEMFPGFLDPNVADADQDVDTTDGGIGSVAQPDGLTNAEEFALGTDPSDADSDDDGILDGEEVIAGLDGFITDPLNGDSDGDGLLDGEETSNTNGFITDPNKVDTDSDTHSDKDEIANGTDPLDANDPPAGALPSEGLIALYKLDEVEGTTATDSADLDGDQSSTEATGTIAWNTDGIIGGAIDLDGSSFLRVPDALPNTATAFTMTAWIKPGNEGSYRGVFATRDVGATPNLNWGLNVEGTLQGDMRFATPATSAGYDTPGVVVDEWNHLAMTWDSDGFNAVGKAYLNGAYIGEYNTNDNGISATYSSTGFYLLGAEPNPNRSFVGLIDEVSVWDVALTGSDVSNIYRNGLLGNGLSGPSSVELAITSVDVAANGNVTLVWNSKPAAGTTYLVKYTTDLSLPFEDWFEIDDSKTTEGDSTTLVVSAANLATDNKYFFAVKQN
ncbi:LamG-like jellyroll fold domain-containing protein [Verrucomicrobiaceae bacterium 227]